MIPWYQVRPEDDPARVHAGPGQGKNSPPPSAVPPATTALRRIAGGTLLFSGRSQDQHGRVGGAADLFRAVLRHPPPATARPGLGRPGGRRGAVPAGPGHTLPILRIHMDRPVMMMMMMVVIMIMMTMMMQAQD